MEFLALIFGLAGLIWGTVLLKRGGLLAGCLAVLLAGACFSVEFFKLQLGPIPLTIDRLLFLILIGQYLVWRRFGWTDPKPLSKPEIVLCLFMAVLAVSTFSADYSVKNYQPVAWLIIFYLMPFGLYWIARQSSFSVSFRSAKAANFREAKGDLVIWLFVSLAVFGIYLAITSLAEHYELTWAIFPRYIVDTAARADAEFVGRARGPFLHPIGNGIALAICFAASLMLWPQIGRGQSHFREGEAPAEPNEIPTKSTSFAARREPRPPAFLQYRFGQLLLIPLFLLFAAAIYVTLTRSVWMGGAFVLALIVGLALTWNWRMPLFLGGLLVAVAVSVSQWDRLVAFKRDKNVDASKTAESAELRPVLARIAWNMFLDRPLMGCGYAQYGQEHVNYLSDRSTEVVLEKGRGYIQHNVAFSLLTETGLLGLGLFLALSGLWAFDAWSLWRSPSAPLPVRQMGLLTIAALGVYFINGMFHDVSVVPLANMTLFFLAGVTEGLHARVPVNPRRVGIAHQSETPQYDPAPVMVCEVGSP
jgi:hypothetical protein